MVGVAELRKPQVVRSIRIAGSKYLAHLDIALLSNRNRRSGFCHGSIGNGLGFPCWNLTLSHRFRRLPEPRDPLNRCLQVRGTQVGIPCLTRAVVEWRNSAAMVPSLWHVIVNGVTADALTELKSILHVSEPIRNGTKSAPSVQPINCSLKPLEFNA